MSMEALAQTNGTDTQMDLASVTDFITREMQLLDDRQFEEWMDLFAEDGYYWAPIKLDQENPYTHVSLFYDEKPTMKTRIARLRHPKVFMQQPHSRTVHLISNVSLNEVNSEGDLSVRCNFVMLEYRPTRSQNTWGGRYDYVLRRSNDATFSIVSKKTTLLNSDDQFPSLGVWF